MKNQIKWPNSIEKKMIIQLNRFDLKISARFGMLLPVQVLRKMKVIYWYFQE
jgi:hypothetical protein